MSSCFTDSISNSWSNGILFCRFHLVDYKEQESKRTISSPSYTSISFERLQEKLSSLMAYWVTEFVFSSLSRSTTESRLTKQTVDGQPFKWLRRPSICDEGQFQGVFNTHFFWMDQGNCWGWWLIAMADFKVSWWKR